MKKLIGVIGAGQCDDQTGEIAFRVGQEIARRGYGLICGGLGGVMEQAARGCKDGGGVTIGILPQEDAQQANPFIDIAIPTGMGIARNLLIVRSAIGLVAVDGRYGTLSEIAYALQLGKPLVGIRTWDVSEKIVACGDAVAAIEKLVEMISDE